jgi:hypothetical protein
MAGSPCLRVPRAWRCEASGCCASLADNTFLLLSEKQRGILLAYYNREKPEEQALAGKQGRRQRGKDDIIGYKTFGLAQKKS